MQYFTREYTSSYLTKRYVKKRAGYVSVFDKDGNLLAEVKMKLGKGRDKRAMITSDWMDVVDQMDMKEEQVYMFWFRRVKTVFKKKKSLKLIVERVH